MEKIIYTLTDEAPGLATRSLLPVLQAYGRLAGIGIEGCDISLAARILARFPDFLPDDKRVSDTLDELGELTRDPSATIIKLPNISASVPQLKAAIAELRAKDFPLPEYPEEPTTSEEQEVRSRYDRIKGSAVNPVLREGNSDRRAPESVKRHAQANPHRMGVWEPDSRTRVATMASGDFHHNEQSVVLAGGDVLTIRHVDGDGTVTVLRDGLESLPGEVVDATVMRATALDDFLAEQVAAAKREGLLFSVHLKATMMKVSDPIIFGHVVKAFIGPVLERHGDALAAAGLSPDEGLGAILAGLEKLPDGKEIRAEIDTALAAGPALAMVDSTRGITNLHVPSDVIVDASMPAMIRASGHMWGPDGAEADTLAVLPDSSYAGVYQAVIDDCRAHGAYDPRTMGTVPNVGLMAQQAEEYGSHDKTFHVEHDGRIEVVNSAGDVLLHHDVAAGDIWRACHTKDAAIRDWVGLAVTRARATGWPTVFWLDETRAHDRNLLLKVKTYLTDHEIDDLDIRVLPPVEATRFTVERIRRGENTISVTGNVLRDYLTDLFPILELGTSAKMLSIVPLMAGGGLFETGAGGSAPKHVQQLLAENYLRWDSLGEFLALAASLEHLASTGNTRAGVLAATLDRANGRYLAEDKSPTRRLGGTDNRGSHYWLARFWAEELAAQRENTGLAVAFEPIARALAESEDAIVSELIAVQGASVDIGGYYLPDEALASAVMRPSPTFNAIIDGI
ncbi:NADP-dependent isocitrate dehydrogenase [Arachnia propionica]|uniref:NADP-dependent isocitrate dehydrogenase n=1 Tax=Arachnia propionica TaxID=1750 RepID=UPI0030D613BC